MMKYSLCILSVMALLVFSGCGKAIEKTQEYEKNAPPSIAGMGATNTDGTVIDSDRIVPSAFYKITATASDPDNQDLTYTFSSDSGSFKDQAAIPGGSMVTFKTGSISGETKVLVSVSVSDSHGGTAATNIDIGTGKLGPVITVAADTTHIQSSGAVNLTVSANCTGVFQVYPNADGAIKKSADVSIDYSKDMMVYPKASGNVVAVVAGPVASTAANFQLTKVPGVTAYDKIYTAWVVFADGLGQKDAIPVSIYVDDIPPTVTATNPVSGAVSVSTEPLLLITFSEDMDKSSLSGALSVTGGAVGTVHYDSISGRTARYSVSGLAKNTTYTVTVSGAKDTVGNSANPADPANRFPFMTTPTWAVTYDDGSGGSVGIDSASYEKNDPVTVTSQTPVRTGYIFQGWKNSSDLTVYHVGGTFAMPTLNVALSATWTANTYHVKFNENGGSGAIADQDIVMGSSTHLTLNSFTYSGKTFMGWSKSSGGAVVYTDGAVYPEALDQTLYAVWQYIPVTSVNITQTSVFMMQGASSQLTAAVFPPAASIKTLTWASSNPSAAAVDATGKVDTLTPGYAKITATSVDGAKTDTCQITVMSNAIAVSSYAGSGSSGTSDGAALAATFTSPTDITTDGTYLYVLDVINNSGNTGSANIRKITISTGAVATLATVSAGNGSLIYGGGVLYLSDGYARVYKVATSNGALTPWVGNGTPTDPTSGKGSGYSVGVGTSACCYYPGCLTFYGTFLYLPYGDNVVQVNVLNGTLTYLNSVTDLTGAAVDANGCYTLNSRNYQVWRINANNTESPIIGGGNGFADGLAAQMGTPGRIISAGSDTFYFCDTGNHAIRKLTVDSSSKGTIVTIAGNGSSGSAEGNGLNARFNFPIGLCMVGTTLYVTDTGNHRIRKITLQ